MNAVDFIRSKIDLLVEQFTSVKCSYEYDKNSSTHLIEILPSSTYKSNNEYINAESKIIDEFLELFPHESICFITDDSIVEIKKPTYIAEGINYNLTCVILQKYGNVIPLSTDLIFDLPEVILNIQYLPSELIIVDSFTNIIINDDDNIDLKGQILNDNNNLPLAA